jgi:starch synthase (maltosyl-transferring)
VACRSDFDKRVAVIASHCTGKVQPFSGKPFPVWHTFCAKAGKNEIVSYSSMETTATHLSTEARNPPAGGNEIPEFHGRVTIEDVQPRVDDGRFAIKSTVGEKIAVEADIFADGHDSLSAVVKYRHEKQTAWSESALKFVENDRWNGEFAVAETGKYFYTIEAWINRFRSWQKDLEKRVAAGQVISVELLVGAELIESTRTRAPKADAESLGSFANKLRNLQKSSGANIVPFALDKELTRLMEQSADRGLTTVYQPELAVMVEPQLARFGAWYEIFPRSFGNFNDCAAQLPRIARMGFDVLYLPPIHPIGKSFRKGRNNNVACEPGEPGSPWAIGSEQGGHKSVNPELGTLGDFKKFVAQARDQKLEVALDIAFQCAPDHPYVKDHPDWFRHRPDGSIQCAENPPKIYQDIVPFNFECESWRDLWKELRSIFEFWMEQGIHIFRVDNPHTKTFAFWEWCIGALKDKNPDLIFLAEAFTRPKVLYRLAKLGFTQSYNYFPWRNTKDELETYFTELTQPPAVDFLRANLWPNTPDILPQFLQTDGQAAFAIRCILAATLGASYGIYGPAFEVCENAPREPGSEEYLNSEKYEIKHWDLAAGRQLEGLLTRLNQIRRENPALQSNRNLRFHHTDNPQLIAYTKTSDDGSDDILCVVNLSPHYTHSGWLDLPLADFHLDTQRSYQMHDLLSEARYLWKGEKNYIELNPARTSAHIFRLRRLVKTEHDFDYYQ